MLRERTGVQAKVVEGAAEVGGVGLETRAHAPRQPVEQEQRLLPRRQHVPPHARHVGLPQLCNPLMPTAFAKPFAWQSSCCT